MDARGYRGRTRVDRHVVLSFLFQVEHPTIVVVTTTPKGSMTSTRITFARVDIGGTAASTARSLLQQCHPPTRGLSSQAGR